MFFLKPITFISTCKPYSGIFLYIKEKEKVFMVPHLNNPVYYPDIN